MIGPFRPSFPHFHTTHFPLPHLQTAAVVLLQDGQHAVISVLPHTWSEVWRNQHQGGGGKSAALVSIFSHTWRYGGGGQLRQQCYRCREWIMTGFSCWLNRRGSTPPRAFSLAHINTSGARPEATNAPWTPATQHQPPTPSSSYVARPIAPPTPSSSVAHPIAPPRHQPAGSPWGS